MTVPVLTSAIDTPAKVLDAANLMTRKLQDRRPFIKLATDYYRGKEGRLRFASPEFKSYFGKRFEGFSDNWCAPVAQAPVERIGYLGFRLDGERTPNAALARAWERSDANRGLAEALLMMTIAKRSFAMVNPTSSGAQITFEHPDSVVVMRDPVTRERLAGMAFLGGDKIEYAEFQTPDLILRLKRERNQFGNGDIYTQPDLAGWTFDDRAEAKSNPLGLVGIVEMSNQALLDNDPISDIAGVMPMQDSVNLVWAYLLNGLDFASLPGRVVLNGEIPMEEILDAEGQVVGKRPMDLDVLIKDRIAWLGGEGIDIKEWTPASLDVFDKVIERAVKHIASQTRTPGHYLLTGGNTPATGYEAAEAGLVSKARERADYATPAIREINKLVAIAEGMADPNNRIGTGTVIWKKPQYRTETQLMDGLIKMKGAGFPFEFIAEEYGLSPEDVQRVVQMRRDEVSAMMSDPISSELVDQMGAGNGSGTGL